MNVVIQDGETETENPFDIDVMKQDIPEEPKEEDLGKESNRDGLDVSSDEEEGGDDTEQKDNEEPQVTTWVSCCGVSFVCN